MRAFFDRSLLCCLAVAALFAAGPAQSQTPPPLGYIRAGAAIACVSNSDPRTRAGIGDACMNIGPLYIGMPRAEAEQALGQPVQTVETPNGKAYAYLLQMGAQAADAYAVVTYNGQNQADTLQITGKAWKGNWEFSGLSLGMPAEKIIARLGEPSAKRPSEEAGTLLWVYDPMTFSFEVKDGLLTSIRVAAE